METGRERVKITGFHWLFLIFTSRTFKDLCYKLEREKILDTKVLSYLVEKMLQFSIWVVIGIGISLYLCIPAYKESGMNFYLYVLGIFIWFLTHFLFYRNVKRLEVAALAHSTPVLAKAEIISRSITSDMQLWVSCKYFIGEQKIIIRFLAGGSTDYKKWKNVEHLTVIYSSMNSKVACPYDERMCERFCLSRKKIKPLMENGILEGGVEFFGRVYWGITRK